jgi:hypothetical protein
MGRHYGTGSGTAAISAAFIAAFAVTVVLVHAEVVSLIYFG